MFWNAPRREIMENVRFAHQIRRQMVLIQHIMFGQNGKNGDPSTASIEENAPETHPLRVRLLKTAGQFCRATTI